MEWVDYARFAAALVFVIGLIVGLSYLVRRFGLAGAVAVSRSRTDRRLSVVESLPLDGKRRLVLLRCDDNDHLVLLGPNQDVALGMAAPAKPPMPPAGARTPPSGAGNTDPSYSGS